MFLNTDLAIILSYTPRKYFSFTQINSADAKQAHKNIHVILQKHYMLKKQNGTSQEQHINHCISLKCVSEASTETKIPSTLSIYNLCRKMC